MTAQRKIRKPSRTSSDAVRSNIANMSDGEDGDEAGADPVHAVDALQIFVRLRILGLDLLGDLLPLVCFLRIERRRHGSPGCRGASAASSQVSDLAS